MWLSVLVATLVTFSTTVSPYEYGYGRQYTREVHIKQGVLRGLIVDSRWNHVVGSAEQYLGLPYAGAPVGEMRFMPPGSAPQWPGTKICDTPSPVCPQQLPNLQKMSADRRDKFNRLRKHLVNESEDCLYLNIYAPKQGTIYLYFIYLTQDIYKRIYFLT